ncbi:MAG: hypothetical protein CMM52_06410 [Rhodospirillaceae bacterium]|nr:hypothetical protein [Rhodospirillaceae bacterium]|tara:strand:+ start:14802 stop:15377 length:576 start_codon:yes stop_codon:yes gene_type:complete
MGQYSIPAFNEFIDEMHEHFAKGLPEVEQWEGVRPLLRKLISDDALLEASKGWERKKGREYILHHDPEYDFFVGALVREPKHTAMAHDHGPTWTIYGVLDGQEVTHVYERTDDGSKEGYAELELKVRSDAPAGTVDIVPPHIPHAENGNSPRSVAITVRTTKPGSYDQVMFNLETGKTGTSRGLVLVPLAI